MPTSPDEIPDAPRPSDRPVSDATATPESDADSSPLSEGGAPEAAAEDGRLILVTGPGARASAQALASKLTRATCVDGAVLGAMIPEAAVSELEARFLRYTAGIALADSFRLAGFDVVLTEDVPDQHVEDYLDFAAPTPIHLVRIDDPAPGGSVDDQELSGMGIVVVPGTPDSVADAVMARLDDSVIGTEARPE